MPMFARSRRACGRSRSRRNAARADGWARADGIRAGARGRHHAADRERPLARMAAAGSRRREAGPASLSSARIAGGGTNDRKHHAGGIGHGAASGRSRSARGMRRCGRHEPATTILPAGSALRSRTRWWRADTPSWQTTPVGDRRRHRALRADRHRRRRALGPSRQALGAILCRPCLDWSERRPHLAGAVGAALCAHSFDKGWIRRIDGTRAVAVTPKGQRIFREASARGWDNENADVRQRRPNNRSRNQPSWPRSIGAGRSLPGCLPPACPRPWPPTVAGGGGMLAVGVEAVGVN